MIATTQDQTLAIMRSAGELFEAGRSLYEMLAMLGYDVNDAEIDAWLQAQESYHEALRMRVMAAPPKLAPGTPDPRD